MSRGLCFGSFFLPLLALCAPAAVGQDSSAAHHQAQKWAVLIGVDDYIEIRKLKFAGADQRALAEQLVASGFPQDQVFVLHDKATDKKYLPFRENIEKQLDLVLRLTQPNDLVILGFSGHGVQLEGKSYICPEDARVDKLAATLISLDGVYERLGKCKASLKLMLVDACRNDVLPEGQRSLGLSRGLGEFDGTKAKPPEGILLLTSCGAGQVSMEDPDLGHGVFMHFVLQGLKGKAANDSGTVTLMGLYDYASLQTKKYVARTFNNYQSPAFEGKVNGPFEICSLSPASAGASSVTRDPEVIKLRKTPSPMVAGSLSLVPRPRIEPSFNAPHNVIRTITNSIGMKLAFIPAGEFMMGTPESDKDAPTHEKPQHRVKITKPFYLGAYPVTLGEFLTFYHDAKYKLEMERDGKETNGYDENGKLVKSASFRPWAPGWKVEMNHPVVDVTWDDAVAFCEWLSRKEGKTYRLPTEAEWEYACRGGSTTRYSFGDDAKDLSDYAWFDYNKNGNGVGTHPVGQKRPNDLGLYDMHGHVWQVCSDWYDASYYSASTTDDPKGPSSGWLHVTRGGGWLNFATFCRSATRGPSAPGGRGRDVGFRVALVPADK